MGSGRRVNRTAVLDTGPIIHLADINALHLLKAFPALLIPTVVYEELEIGGVPPKLEELDYTLSDVEHTSHKSLDPGESAALRIAQQEDAVFLTDDLAAREEAVEHGVTVHGSIGVIALGYYTGALTQKEAEQLMRDLQKKSSLFITDAVIEHGIKTLQKT